MMAWLEGPVRYAWVAPESIREAKVASLRTQRFARKSTLGASARPGEPCGCIRGEYVTGRRRVTTFRPSVGELRALAPKMQACVTHSVQMCVGVMHSPRMWARGHALGANAVIAHLVPTHSGQMQTRAMHSGQMRSQGHTFGPNASTPHSRPPASAPRAHRPHSPRKHASGRQVHRSPARRHRSLPRRIFVICHCTRPPVISPTRARYGRRRP